MKLAQKKKVDSKNLIPLERVERQIYLIRGEKVMFDSDLAELYQVLTKNLNLAVRRNKDRFPKDFMFQLTKEESENWKSQIMTSNLRLQFATSSYGGRRYLPYVFTLTIMAHLTVTMEKMATNMISSLHLSKNFRN